MTASWTTSLWALSRERVRRSAIVLACVLGLALVAVSEAGAHVYWTNNTTNTIGRANLAATGVNQSLITAGGGPYGMSVHGAYVYWSNATSIGGWRSTAHISTGETPERT